MFLRKPTARTFNLQREAGDRASLLHGGGDAARGVKDIVLRYTRGVRPRLDHCTYLEHDHGGQVVAVSIGAADEQTVLLNNYAQLVDRGSSAFIKNERPVLRKPGVVFLVPAIRPCHLCCFASSTCSCARVAIPLQRAASSVSAGCQADSDQSCSAPSSRQ